MQVYGTKTLTVAGAITQVNSTDAATVAILGGATVIYQGCNTYKGDTYVNNGTLQIASGASMNSTGVIRLGN